MSTDIVFAIIAGLFATEISYLLLGVAILSALWLLTAYRGRIAAVGRAIKTQSEQPYNPEPRPALPAASIVVVAGDDAAALEALLAKLFDQEFASPMEVIVVNDGKNEDVKDVVTRLKHLEHRPNLYITFTPAELRNVSHRKLAVSLGVKAAKNPVILLLTEQSRIYSRQWLGRMVAPFANPQIELVIGSAMPSTKADSGMGVRYRSFTHAADTVQWLSAALRGKPWRGHRANLAFTSEAFFRSGGFNGALNLRTGDDDIFVSRMARPGNNATVVATQAQVRYLHPTARREFSSERPARFFSSRGLGKGSRRFFGFSSLMNWTLLLSCLLAAALGVIVEAWWVVVATGVLLLTVWLTLALTWRTVLARLRCRPALLAIPFRMLRRPFTNLHHKLSAHRRRSEYYTWT